MNFKKELQLLRFFFKQNGLEYADLEEKLNYGKGTIRSTIARGGTEMLLIQMKQLKQELFPDHELPIFPNNIVQEPQAGYDTKSLKADIANLREKLIDAQTDLIKAKTENSILIKENGELKEQLAKYKSLNAENPTYTLLGETQRKKAAS